MSFGSRDSGEVAGGWLAAGFKWRGDKRVTRAIWALVAIAAIWLVASQYFSKTPPAYFLELLIIQSLYAISVNLLIGYANLPSLGQAAFFGVGAYAAALTIQGVPLWISLLIATVVAAVMAGLVGVLALRTSGIAFANVTLAFGQVLFIFASNTRLVGGENGITGVTPKDVSPQQLWLIIVVISVVSIFAMWWILRSPFGDTLKAIRDNAVRASSLGIPVFRYRLVLFIIAGGFAGVAGALFGYATGIATADVFHWTRSGEPIIMCILGGRGKFLGPALGAIALTTLLQQVGQGSTAYMVYVGVILLVMLTALPHGLLSLPERIRSILTSRPFLGQGKGKEAGQL